MKKVFTLFAIIGMFLFVSCGNSAENKEQGEADAIESADELLEEANEAATMEASKDSTSKDSTSTNVEMETPSETEGEAHESAE